MLGTALAHSVIITRNLRAQITILNTLFVRKSKFGFKIQIKNS